MNLLHRQDPDVPATQMTNQNVRRRQTLAYYVSAGPRVDDVTNAAV